MKLYGEREAMKQRGYITLIEVSIILCIVGTNIIDRDRWAGRR